MPNYMQHCSTTVDSYRVWQSNPLSYPSADMQGYSYRRRITSLESALPPADVPGCHLLPTADLDLELWQLHQFTFPEDTKRKLRQHGPKLVSYLEP
jgi:hypothetical protein